MADEQHIVLHLEANTVSLNIPREQEPFFRRAAKMLNENYQYYRRLRPKASVEQLWMYVALRMAVNLQSDASKYNVQPVDEKLTQLNSLIQEELDEAENMGE